MARYRTDLDDGELLTVDVPAFPKPTTVLEIADQLRELADAIVVASNQLQVAPHAREDLLRTSELLRVQQASVKDYEGACDLLEFYGRFRDAVVDYLRTVVSSH
jgi:hypothetical protein